MNPEIALVVIAKNEEACIGRCLDSAQGVVDRMLVLDTGSTDRTAEIAAACGASVHAFTWCDDFAAARNRALDLADADWHLVLDADEWLDAGSRIARESLREPHVGLVRIHHLDDATGHVLTHVTWVPRLLPRAVRYEGVVHEQPVSPLPRRRSPALLHHDGFLGLRRAGKEGRNRALLLRCLQRDPGDAYLLYQLGVDAEIHGDPRAAAGHYADAHARIAASCGWAQTLVVRWLHCLCRAGDLDTALQLVEHYRTVWPDSPDVFFTAGNVYLDQANRDPAGALDIWLPRAVQAWERCLAIG
jgi:glycosyltransferase involved in cell wall biosynthesis